jgi:hypothetical protein
MPVKNATALHLDERRDLDEGILQLIQNVDATFGRDIRNFGVVKRMKFVERHRGI